jgi:hypothetical protein
MLFFITTFSVYGIDFVVVDYLPSVRGRVAGTDVIWNRFQGREDVEGLSLPFEMKLGIASAGPVALSAIAGYTLCAEDGIGLASVNISLGAGFSSLKMAPLKTALTGFYVGLYPLYEFPLATQGKDPVASWKIALDLGYGISIGTESDPAHIYIYLYSRWLGVFGSINGRDFFYPNWPDFGIALGFHILKEW